MSIDRQFRRDGESEYPELSESEFQLEYEFALLTDDRDRLDLALLRGLRYVRPYDVAKIHWPQDAALMREVFGPGRGSDKYGRRLK